MYLGTSAWVSFTTAKSFGGKYGAVVIQGADPSMNFFHAQMENAGSCVRWFAGEFYADSPGLPPERLYSQLDAEAERSQPGVRGLLFAPWVFGERVPFTDTRARGAFINLDPQHTRGDLARAILEGVAYNIAWTMECVERGFGFSLARPRVAGGGARSPLWMQVLADVTGKTVDVVTDPQEVSAVGAALAAAVGLGVYPNFGALKKLPRIAGSFEPRSEVTETYRRLFEVYRRLHQHLRPIYKRLNG